MGTKSPGTVQKTRRMLMEALFRLLEKRSFKDVSIGDICAEAMVSRSAFYLHFADKYELLRCILDEVMNAHEEQCDGLDVEAQLSALLNSVLNKKKMMFNTFLADPNHEMLEIFSDSLSNFVRKHLEMQNSSDRNHPETEELVVAFYAGGLAGILAYWVRGGFSVPQEKITLYLTRLLTSPAFGA